MGILDADKLLFEILTLNVNPPWLSALCETIGNLSTYTIPAILFSIIYYWLDSPRFVRFAIALAVLLAFSEGSAWLVKNLVARPRPAVEWLIYVDSHAVGFPSAHAVNSMALAVFAAHWFGKKLRIFLVIPAVIGASRVLANYHYPLDVIGGWAIGYVVATAYWHFAKRLYPRFFASQAPFSAAN